MARVLGETTHFRPLTLTQWRPEHVATNSHRTKRRDLGTDVFYGRRKATVSGLAVAHDPPCSEPRGPRGDASARRVLAATEAVLLLALDAYSAAPINGEQIKPFIADLR